MPDIPDNSVDMVLCDLPYGTTECPWDNLIPMEHLWEQYRRVLKHQGSVLLFGSEPFSTSLRNSNMGWYKYDWIWVKPCSTGFQHAKNMPLKDFEIISVFSGASMGHESLLGDKRMTYNPQGLNACHEVGKHAKHRNIMTPRPSHKAVFTREQKDYPRMVLFFDGVSGKERRHPTEKPVDLLRYLIRTYTGESDVVLDNCCGSGSTCVAALMEKRRYIGIEKEKEYCDIARKRTQAITNQLTLF